MNIGIVGYTGFISQQVQHSFMKGHNYGLCRKCGKTHTHPNGALGKKWSEEAKQKRSEAYQGRGNSFYGRKHTEETKAKISRANKGIIFTEEWKKQQSERMSGEGNPFFGKKHTEETRAKMKRNRPNQSGELNPAWIDGRSYEPYGPRWEKLREEIRERDSHTCQKCGGKQKREKLIVHHIDGNKKNNEPSNLICYCRSCHGKVEWRDGVFA